MQLDLHPDFSVQKIHVGRERAPLLVIDNFVHQADDLAARAAAAEFTTVSRFYPGIRAEAPPAYAPFLIRSLGKLMAEFFELPPRPLNFSMCHYSLVTTPPHELSLLQRIPHVDSFSSLGLASVHYLFKAPLGGTAFYRHRKTGFEVIDESRMKHYFASLESENGGPNIPQAAYINGDTPLFERIAMQEGVFNRILIYRRNSLHSGAISEHFVPDPNPLTGRLSVNCFIDMVG